MPWLHVMTTEVTTVHVEGIFTRFSGSGAVVPACTYVHMAACTDVDLLHGTVWGSYSMTENMFECSNTHKDV